MTNDYKDLHAVIGGMFAEVALAMPERSIGELVADSIWVPSDAVVLENAALLRGERVVRESASTTTSVARKAGGTYTAKVGDSTRPTANRRLYSRSEWARVVKHATENLCPAGLLGGAVDHCGMLDGGAAKRRCILWRSLELRSDGSVFGDFEIVAGHSDGANLLAWLEAGGGLAFSTAGRATAREPSAEERRQYGLVEGDGVVIVENWSLTGIDVVDNPAVFDAVLPGRKSN